MAWYSAELGSYVFDVTPAASFETTDVTRKGIASAGAAVLVARYYTFTLRCRLRADTPAAVVTAFQSFLSTAINTRTIPSYLKIKDAGGTALAQFGDVREGTSENWEDLAVERLVFDHGDGQLMAGAEFTVTFSARRSFPDSNGICEFVQEREVEPDDSGNEVRRLSTEIRLAKNYVTGFSASNTITATAAIVALLKEPCPVGWRRTKGATDPGYAYRMPLYPATHYAFTVSEVTKNGGSGGSTPQGATEAKVTTTTEDDPARGIQTVTTVAYTKGAVDAQGWVESQQPADTTGQIEVTPETKEARGEWKKIVQRSGLSYPGKITRIRRTFHMTGGGAEGGAIVMSRPYGPILVSSGFTAYRLIETIELRALALSSLADIPVPAALPAPWLMVEPTERGLPRPEEDANTPASRLWRMDVTRNYIWPGPGDPLGDPALAGAILAPAGESV